MKEYFYIPFLRPQLDSVVPQQRVHSVHSSHAFVVATNRLWTIFFDIGLGFSLEPSHWLCGVLPNKCSNCGHNSVIVPLYKIQICPVNLCDSLLYSAPVRLREHLRGNQVVIFDTYDPHRSNSWYSFLI